MDLIITVSVLILCYITGKTLENNHYKKIKERELRLYKEPYVTFAKNINSAKTVENASLVSASVVFGCDYFKAFVAGLKNIFGGNISAYESVLDRGRREAILRIRESALRMKAHIVVNLKIETVMLSPVGSKNGLPKVCITAYGTAIKYEK